MAVEEADEERRLQTYLPPGMIFLPTDEELLLVYLLNEVKGSRPSPRRIHLPFRELYGPGSADPWVIERDLAFPYGRKDEFYCYTRRSRRNAGVCRAAGSGTWCAKGEEVAIRARGTRRLLGHKLMLKFVPNGGDTAGDPRHTCWRMHEYRLPNRRRDPSSASSSSSSRPLQKLVICRVYRRRGGTVVGSPDDSEDWEEDLEEEEESEDSEEEDDLSSLTTA